MKLSNQAVGAVMMALQKSLIEQSDIVPILRGFKLLMLAIFAKKVAANTISLGTPIIQSPDL